MLNYNYLLYVAYVDTVLKTTVQYWFWLQEYEALPAVQKRKLLLARVPDGSVEWRPQDCMQADSAQVEECQEKTTTDT